MSSLKRSRLALGGILATGTLFFACTSILPADSSAHYTFCKVRANKPHQSAHNKNRVAANATTKCKYPGDTPTNIAAWLYIARDGVWSQIAYEPTGKIIKPQFRRAVVSTPCRNKKRRFMIESHHRIRSHASPTHPPPGFSVNTSVRFNTKAVKCK